MKFIKFKFLSICALALLVASCGGDKVTFSIGGSVSGPGLSTTNPLVLQDNGTDNLNVTSNAFAFATQLEAGSEYDVTILTQPSGQTCFVENGIGVVQTSIGNVNSIAVVCNESTSASNEVAVQVNNLHSGNTLTLVNNGTNSLTVPGVSGNAQVNSDFQLPLALNATYDVAVQTQPTGQICTIANASGTITLNGMVSTASITAANPQGTLQGPAIVTCQ
jgi:hypothetical protein